MKIALTGRLRSGKSTVAQYLCAIHDYMPFAFGNPLKDAFHRAFPNVPRNPKPRAMYQRFGTWAREAMGEDVWIDATMADVEAYVKRHGCEKCGESQAKVLIEDCRQENELQRLKAEGFVIIRINAPEELRIKRALDAGDVFVAEDLRHSTELDVEGFDCDFEVNNEGNTLELYAQIDAILAEIGGD